MDMGRHKLPTSQRKDIVLGVRCDQGLKRKLDELARAKELTLVQVMRAALKHYVEKGAA